MRKDHHLFAFHLFVASFREWTVMLGQIFDKKMRDKKM